MSDEQRAGSDESEETARAGEAAAPSDAPASDAAGADRPEPDEPPASEAPPASVAPPDSVALASAAPAHRPSYVFLAVVSVVSLVLDLGSKEWATSRLGETRSIEVIAGH